MKKFLLPLTATASLASFVMTGFAHDHTGFYLGANAGSGAWNLSVLPTAQVPDISKSSFSGTGVAAQLNLGYGVQPNNFPMLFGLELSGNFYPLISESNVTLPDFPGESLPGTTIVNWSYNLLAVTRYFVVDSFNLSLKIGPSLLQTIVIQGANSAGSPPPPSSLDIGSMIRSTMGLFMAGGIAWNITPAFALTAECQYATYNPSLGSAAVPITSMSFVGGLAGVSYTFLRDK